MNNVFDRLGNDAERQLASVSEWARVSAPSVSTGQYQISELSIAAGVLSIFFITVILYSLVCISEIRRNEKKNLHLADLF